MRTAPEPLTAMIVASSVSYYTTGRSLGAVSGEAAEEAFYLGATLSLSRQRLKTFAETKTYFCL